MPNKPAPIKYARARELRRAMTDEECQLWEWLRANRFKGLHFRRQHVIAGFIVDFYCREARLVVEVDGTAHAAQPDYDAERDAILAGHGFHVLRLPNAAVREDMEAVLRQIEAACEGGGSPLPPSPSPSSGRG